MTWHSRWLAALLVMAMLAAACGGDGGTDAGADGAEATTVQDDSSPDPDDGSPPAAGDSAGFGEPDLDPSSMPPAGEAVLEIDGQTFTIRAAEMDQFTCADDGGFLNIRATSATRDLTVQFTSDVGRGNVTLTDADLDVRYDSFFSAETGGGITVEMPYVVYEARFDATNNEDFSITDVGPGRVLVTCP